MVRKLILINMFGLLALGFAVMYFGATASSPSVAQPLGASGSAVSLNPDGRGGRLGMQVKGSKGMKVKRAKVKGAKVKSPNKGG